MRIHLDQVNEEPFRWQETLDISPDTLERPELSSLAPVRWEGIVTAADPGYYLKARLRTEHELECDRCLGPVKEPVDQPLELLILTHEDRPVAEELELDEEDMSILHLDGHELDLEPILLEQLQLSLPMKPLCREDCKGLCPQCGADLNEGPCDCEDVNIDPRWAALKGLKDAARSDGDGDS